MGKNWIRSIKMEENLFSSNEISWLSVKANNTLWKLVNTRQNRISLCVISFGGVQEGEGRWYICEAEAKKYSEKIPEQCSVNGMRTNKISYFFFLEQGS